MESEKLVILDGSSKIIYKLNGPRKNNLLEMNSPLVYRMVKVDKVTLKEINQPSNIPAKRIERDMKHGFLKEYTNFQRQLDLNF